MRKKKLITLGISAMVGVASLALAISTLPHGAENGFIKGSADIYSITLNSGNHVTTDTTYHYTTPLGNDVPFTYYNTGAYSSGHVTLKSGGCISNDNIIRSIDSFKVVFSSSEANPLKFKNAYSQSKWSDEVILLSDKTYDLSDTHPYFLMFSATATVTIESIQINYTCVVNSDADPIYTPGENYYQKVTATSDVTDGQYLIVYESGSTAYILNASLTTLDATSNTVTASISSNQITPSTQVDNASFTYTASNGAFKNASNQYLSTTKAKSISWASSPAEHDVSINAGGNALITHSSVGADLQFNDGSDQMRFRYYSTAQKSIWLYKKVSSEPSEDYNVPDIPTYEIGFSVVDTTTNYTENSIFANDNGLVVTPLRSDSTSGAPVDSSQYSYVVRDSANNVVDHTVAFGTTGEYTVTVSYKDFIPAVLDFTVGEFVEVTSITNNFDSGSVTFVTSHILSDYIETVFSTSITFNHSEYNVSNLKYSQFASVTVVPVSLALIDPSNVTHNITDAFGIDGDWTIKVTAGTMSASTVITVDAIEVEDITITPSELVMEVGGTPVLLTANVGPDGATNKNVTWSSTNTAVATVSDTGLVTAVSAGTAIIRATATDGSGVIGECTVTVTAPVTPADEGDFVLMEDSGAPAVGDYVIFASSSSNGSAYAMSSTQSSNNRAGETVTISNKTITRGSSSAFGAFEVKAGNTDGTISFYDSDNDGYLCAVNGTNNYLRTENSVTDYSSWTITGSEEKTITAAAGSKNLLKHNTSSHAFSCYGSTSGGVSAVSIYRKDGVKIYPTAITISGDSEVAMGSTSTYSIGSWTPTNTNVKSVTWSVQNGTGQANISSAGVLTPTKAGTVTVKAEAVGENNTVISATKNVTIDNVAVTSVSLNTTATSVEAGKTVTLVETIQPSNATNKAVTWSSSNEDVATVSSAGIVSGKAEGTSVITVTTTDGGKTATCTVTVTSSSGGGGGGSGGGVEDVLTLSDTGVSAGSSSYTSWNSVSLVSDAVYAGQCAGGNNAIQLRSNNNNSGIITTASGGDIYKVTIDWNSNTSNRSVYVYGKSTAYSSPADLYNSSSQGTLLATISCDDSDPSVTVTSGSYQYIGICSTYGALYIDSVTFQWGQPEPTDPTGVSIESAITVGTGKTRTLTPTYIPSNANQNKGITWTSSNNSVATVSSGGVVTGVAIGTATITATLTSFPSIKDTCTVTVEEVAADDYTLLFYVCGADLESGSGRYATADIKELLSIRNQQPDGVNIVVETGGAKSWGMSNVNKDKLGHFVIDSSSTNSQMTFVENINKANMGEASTLQAFLEWGIQNYPANKYGLFMWNHGGAMDGCCFDENYDDDSLTSYEVYKAVNDARNNLGMSEKMEFIAYDACLMAVQDVAEMNSHNFNYMLSSQESEYAGGYDYDTSFPTLYNNPNVATTTFLSKVGADFMNEQEGDGNNDQTQSVFDLTKMSGYLSAWEDMASTLSGVVNSESKFSTFANCINQAMKYGQASGYSSYNNNYVYDIFDVKGALTYMKSTYSSNTALVSKINAVLTEFDKVVVWNRCGSQMKKNNGSNGMCMFCPVAGINSASSCYASNFTNFSTWRSFCVQYGYWSGSSTHL